MDLNRLPGTHRVHTFVGLALDVDAIGANRERFGQVVDDRWLVGDDLWAFANDCAVEVSDSIPPGLHPADGFFQELT